MKEEQNDQNLDFAWFRWEILSAVEAGMLCGTWKRGALDGLKTESSCMEAPVQYR